MHIRASLWITQAPLSELDLPPEVELKNTLKPNSCGLTGKAWAAIACGPAICCILSCLALVSVCPDALAESLAKEGKSAALQAMAAARGKSASHTLKMAKFHTTRREFKEAIVLWTKLAEAKPDAFAEANLGWSYLQLGEKQKAQKHINRSIQLNPRTIEGYRYLGYLLMSEGKVPEAVKAFHTSMSFDPHHKCNCGALEKLVLSKSKNRKP